MRSATTAGRSAATGRVLDHYLHAADRWLNAHRDPIQLPDPAPGEAVPAVTGHTITMAWFAEEHPGLLAAVALAADEGYDTNAWQLAWCMVTALGRRALWHDLVLVACTARTATSDDPAA
jgi:hypothetical protein